MDETLNQTLLINYLNKSNIVEKQKKLNISDKQLFDKILSKLAQQGFEYEDSINTSPSGNSFIGNSVDVVVVGGRLWWLSLML